MKRTGWTFLWGLFLTGTLAAGEAKAPASLLRKGQWVEWAISLPPQTSTTDKTDTKTPALRLPGLQGKDTDETILCRVVIESIATDGTARLTIHLRTGKATDVVKNEPLDALAFLRVAPPPGPGVRITKRTKTMQLDGKALPVNIRIWESERGGKRLAVERWDAQAIPFGPARLKIDTFEMRAVGFGDGTEPEPAFPLPGETKQKSKTENTTTETTPKKEATR